MEALIGAAEELLGSWQLLSRVLPEKVASRGLLAAVGSGEVSPYEKHVRLDGEWRDVVIVKQLIPANLIPSEVPPGRAS